MVKDLKTTSDSKQGDKTLDFKALGKAKNTKIKGDGKPPLLQPTNAIVKNVEVKIEADKYEHNRDDESAIYHPGYVIITTEFAHPETKEIVTSKDFFRGFRAYLEVDEIGTPAIDDDGDEIISRYYAGTDRSALRKIVNLMLDSNSDINDYGELFYDYMPGLKVQIQSDFNTNPQTGAQTVKQRIVKVIGK